MTWTIRAARPEDGPAIGKLYADTPDGTTLDWSDPAIADWWLVAERDGDIVGAIQVSCSLPWGHIGDMIVRTDVRRQGLGLALHRAAEDAMRRSGAAFMTATVAEPRHAWRATLRRWGLVEQPPPALIVRKDL